jgi:hypothetical protein
MGNELDVTKRAVIVEKEGAWGKGSKRGLIMTKMPIALRLMMEEVATREGRTLSDLTRESVRRYCMKAQADELQRRTGTVQRETVIG